MPASIPIIQVYRYFVRPNMGPICRYRTGACEGSEITKLGIVRINDEQMQIFVPVLIIEKHDEATIRGPILPVDRPALGAGDWLPRRKCDQRGIPRRSVRHQPGQATTITDRLATIWRRRTSDCRTVFGGELEGELTRGLPLVLTSCGGCAAVQQMEAVAVRS